MPDWKRLIVGDAFRLPPRDFNFYRDSFLLWPFLLFSIGAVADLFRTVHDRGQTFKLWALSGLAIALARERMVLVAAALGFCAVGSLLSFVIKHEWLGLAVAILTGTAFFLFLSRLRNYKPSYEWPKDPGVLELLIGLSSLGFTLLIFQWFIT